MSFTTYTMENAQRSWMNELIKKYYVFARDNYWGINPVNQKKILTMTGLSYPGWIKILNGSDMKVSTLIKICDAFNIPVEEAIQHEKDFLQVNGS